MIHEPDIWKIINTYFSATALSSQQLNSFNSFVSTTLQEVVDENRQITISTTNEKTSKELITLTFTQIYVKSTPTVVESDGTSRLILPMEARYRDLTYGVPLFIDITLTKSQENSIEHQHSYSRVPIGIVPVMVRSSHCMTGNMSEAELIALGECPFDKGGYFVVNGSEKVIVAQERMSFNSVHVYEKNGSFFAEVRSVFERGSKSSVPFLVRLVNGRLVCDLPYVKGDVPIGILFRALGFNSDKEILDIVNDYSEIMKNSLEESFVVMDQEVALDFIGKRAAAVGSPKTRRIQQAKYILEKEFLPHIGAKEFLETRKAYFLGYMAKRLLSVVAGSTDDRDHYGKKRLDMAGPLLASLFRTLFKKLVSETSKHMQKCLEMNREFNIALGLKTSIITNGFRYALATGNWGEQSKAMQTKAGVAQVLNRYNYLSTLSHLRRVNTPIGRDGKLAKPRQLHNTHWGMVCPSETPEGQACGLVKNLSLMSYISVGSPASLIIELLDEWGTTPLELLSGNGTKVFVNGVWVGVHTDPEFLVNALVQMRRAGEICREVSIVRDVKESEIRILTDAGRPCRLLFIVENNELLCCDKDTISDNGLKGTYSIFNANKTKDMEKRLIQFESFDDYINRGMIEYLDVEEEETSMICMSAHELYSTPTNTVLYTHCEIHPSMILGICASVIPFPDHNQSPRNTYQSAMGKQAMGIYATNYLYRMDTLSNLLFYPHKPLVATKAMDIVKYRELPAGQNAMVAIACYSGYNQEDSIIVNQSSIDRGLFRSFFYRTVSDQENARPGMNEIFCQPKRGEVLRMKHLNYNKLECDGLIGVGVRVSGDDVLIGKVKRIRSREDGEDIYTSYDCSTAMRNTETGIVDTIVVTQRDGYKFVKVKVRSSRIPQMGDKFASRHGQKGTIGITLRQEDMPFTREGIVPDVIVNPHAIPSRMTIGHLIECLCGKAAALNGIEGDGTPFQTKQYYKNSDGETCHKTTVDMISEELAKHGYNSRGFEVFYCGYTGRKLEAQIFFGPTYYQRLKHMVDDKIHARARGPVQILTRQPVEGRSRDGGLRFGEMERDCIISHGCSAFLRERLFEVSDAYTITICECGYMQSGTCRGCGKEAKYVDVPYAFKLLVQELNAMNISLRFGLE